MKNASRARWLIAKAVAAVTATSTCSNRRRGEACAACDGYDATARDLARTALLATLRKQHLRLTYFEPERERRAMFDELRMLLDRNA